MPVYTYRREDGTTFDIRQSFNDEALKLDPQTGQRVVRVVQNAGVIFKGSGFYVNDSKNASKKSLTTPASKEGENKEAAPAATTDSTSSASTATASSETSKAKEAAPAAPSSAAD